MKAKRRKPVFKVGELVDVPARIVKIDRRYNPERYTVQALYDKRSPKRILADKVELYEVERP